MRPWQKFGPSAASLKATTAPRSEITWIWNRTSHGSSSTLLDLFDRSSGRIAHGAHWLTEFAESYQLVLSLEFATEIRSVFARSVVIRRMAVSAPTAIEFLDKRFEGAVWVYLGSVPHICRDPDDDMVIATAIAADARFLIAADDDLLSLGVVQGVRVVTAGNFLSIIRNSRT